MENGEKVVIIGAGPSGLAIAGRLRRKGINFLMLEKSSRIANSWFNHYDRLHLHTVKDYSYLPFKEFPDDFPTYISKFQLYDYCQEYSRNFDITPEFNTSVISVTNKEKGWTIQCDKNKIFQADHVIISTGVNSVPITPTWKGQEKFKGTIIHSTNYKNYKKYANKKVLVVGMGNTGAELALDLAENNVEVCISIRGPINIVPRDIKGNPTQLTAIKLSKLPLWISDWIGNQLQKITIGNLTKYGIVTPKIAPTKHLREWNKTPVIDIGTVAQIKKGNIKVIGEIDHFTSSGVVDKSKNEHDFDAVVLATGFKSIAEKIVPALKGNLNKFGLPDGLIGHNELEGLYFLGFNSNLPGGILGVLMKDSEIVADQIEARIKSKSSDVL